MYSRWLRDQELIQEIRDLTLRIRCPKCKTEAESPLSRCIKCTRCDHDFCSFCFDVWAPYKDHSSCSNAHNLEDTAHKEQKQLLKNLLQRYSEYHEEMNLCEVLLEEVKYNLQFIQDLPASVKEYYAKEVQVLHQALNSAGNNLIHMKFCYIYLFYTTSKSSEAELKDKVHSIGNCISMMVELVKKIRKIAVSARDFDEDLTKLEAGCNFLILPGKV